MPARELPARPSPEQYKKQAKELASLEWHFGAPAPRLTKMRQSLLPRLVDRASNSAGQGRSC